MDHALTKALMIALLLWQTGTSAAYAQNSEIRPVPAFASLAVQDGIDVYLSQANEQSVRIEVDGYDLEDVVAEVVGGELRLSNSARRAFSLGRGDVEAYIDFVQLSAIKASGGSDVVVRGVTGIVAIQASGGSDVAARGLAAEQATVKVSGGSDASVRASASVAIDASGGSDVSVHGDPAQRTVNNDRSSDVAWR